MINLYLVRHCEYQNPHNIIPGRLPYPLSQQGREHAHRLRDYFKDKQISKIYTSPILRSYETSQHISQGHIPIEEDIRLIEILNAYQGHPITNADELNMIKLRYGGESNKQVQNRMVDFYLTIDFQDNHNYIIVSHGDPLLFLYQYLAKQDLMPDTFSNLEPNTWPGYQEKGSIRMVSLNYQKKVIKVEEIIKVN